MSSKTAFFSIALLLVIGVVEWNTPVQAMTTESGSDFCSADPCLNGGTCASGTSTYTCECATGYSGTDCGTDDSATTAAADESEGDGAGVCRSALNGMASFLASGAILMYLRLAYA